VGYFQIIFESSSSIFAFFEKQNPGMMCPAMPDRHFALAQVD